MNHVYYSCLDENGERIPFPEADLTEYTESDVRELCNVSDAVAMGVTVCSDEKVLLRHAAMLPQERITLAPGANIMVQYGNAVKKGGKSIVAQRVLRCVHGPHDAASAHP